MKLQNQLKKSCHNVFVHHMYKYLFINRHWCILSVPILWRSPFETFSYLRPKLITTLLTCLNEDEIFLLVPFAINFPSNRFPPLFEYGKFIRKIHQNDVRKHAM